MQYSFLRQSYKRLSQTTTPTLARPFFLGQPKYAGARKTNHSEFYWSRDDGVAVASAGPYASHLHLNRDRWQCQHLITQVFIDQTVLLLPKKTVSKNWKHKHAQREHKQTCSSYQFVNGQLLRHSLLQLLIKFILRLLKLLHKIQLLKQLQLSVNNTHWRTNSDTSHHVFFFC